MQQTKQILMSLYSSDSTADTSSMPLPKINIPPSTLLISHDAGVLDKQGLLEEALPHSRLDPPKHLTLLHHIADRRNTRFTLSIIALVITINLLLAWLLGNNTSLLSVSEGHQADSLEKAPEIMPQRDVTTKKEILSTIIK